MSKNSTSSERLKKLIRTALAEGNYGSPKDATLDFLSNFASNFSQPYATV